MNKLQKLINNPRKYINTSILYNKYNGYINDTFYPSPKKSNFMLEKHYNFFNRIYSKINFFNPIYENNNKNLPSHYIWSNNNKKIKFESLFQNGYLVVDNFLDLNEFENIKKYFKDLNFLNDKTGEFHYQEKAVEFVYGKINNYKIQKSFINRLDKFIDTIFESKIKISYDIKWEYLRCIGKDLKDPNTDYHIDKIVPCLKLFYYPFAVDTEGAPFEFKEKSHIISDKFEKAYFSRNSDPKKKKSILLSDEYINSYKSKKITVDDNTLVIAFTNGLHRRSSFLKKKSRISIQLNFYEHLNILSKHFWNLTKK